MNGDEPRVHREQLLAHLSGQLSETDREELERTALTESESFDALEAAESELVEAWVRGELETIEEEIVSAAIAKSPRLQESAELAAALDLRSQLRPSVPAEGFKSGHWIRMGGLALGLVSLLTIVYLAWQLRSSYAEVERQRQALEVLEERSLRKSEEVEKLRQNLARLEAEARLRARQNQTLP